jgi:hypothetical protein
MSDETQITPIIQPPAPVPAARDLTPKPAPTQPPSATSAADTAATSNADGAAVSSPPEKLQSAPVFGLSLQFDPDTHRVIIEARNPLSGTVVFQVPSKSALQALTDAEKTAQRRGKSVNSEA